MIKDRAIYTQIPMTYELPICAAPAYKGEHGARSAKQAVAIGLSKTRRAGVDLKSPKKGTVSENTRKSAENAYKKGQRHEPVSRSRSRAGVKALKDEPTITVSGKA